MKDLWPWLTWRYADFFDETIQVNQKFITFFNISWPAKTIHFLEAISTIRHPKIMTGNDRKYIVPAIPIFIMNSEILSFFLLVFKVRKIPSTNTNNEIILKANNKYDGMVSCMWYLLWSPSFILVNKVNITFIIPSIPTKLKNYYPMEHTGRNRLFLWR